MWVSEGSQSWRSFHSVDIDSDMQPSRHTWRLKGTMGRGHCCFRLGGGVVVVCDSLVQEGMRAVECAQTSLWDDDLEQSLLQGVYCCSLTQTALEYAFLPGGCGLSSGSHERAWMYFVNWDHPVIQIMCKWVE